MTSCISGQCKRHLHRLLSGKDVEIEAYLDQIDQNHALIFFLSTLCDSATVWAQIWGNI